MSLASLYALISSGSINSSSRTLPGCIGGYILSSVTSFSSSQLVIVNDLNLVGISAFEREADAVLLVDANRPLALSVTTQLLQTIAWRSPQVLDVRSSIQD